MDFETKLYIVKKNDTLESISKENDVPISEIIRLNPLSKHNIFEGKPLLLNIKKLEEPKILRNKENNEFDFSCFFLKLKILILSAIFFRKGFEIYYQDFLNYYNKVKIKNDYVKNVFLKIIHTILNMVSILENKNDQDLINMQKELNTYAEELKKEFPEFKHFSIDKMIENLELYVFKLYSESFNEAESYFTLFLKEFNNLIN